MKNKKIQLIELWKLVKCIITRRSGGEEGGLAREVHVITQEHGWDFNFNFENMGETLTLTLETWVRLNFNFRNMCEI